MIKVELDRPRRLPIRDINIKSFTSFPSGKTNVEIGSVCFSGLNEEAKNLIKVQRHKREAQNDGSLKTLLSILSPW